MEELLGRQPPHSAPAEQAVIGAMLIDPSCIPDVIEKVKSDEFYIQANRDIFDTIFAMFSYGQTIDPVTVLDQMKVRGVYTDVSTEYIAELMRITPTAANVLEYGMQRVSISIEPMTACSAVAECGACLPNNSSMLQLLPLTEMLLLCLDDEHVYRAGYLIAELRLDLE